MLKISLKRRVPFVIFMLMLLGLVAVVATSCSPEFNKGAKDGWNSVVRPEYRIN